MSTEDVPKEIKASTEDTPKKDTPKKKKEITMAGKGDKPRPCSTSQEEYARKWDKAFGKSGCAYPLCENYSEGSTEYCCNGCSCDDYDYRRIELEKQFKKVMVKIEPVTPIMDNSESMEGIMKRKSNVTLLNDKSLDAQLEKMKQGHD